MSVVQLTDTHIVSDGVQYFGKDTAAYLTDAIAAVNALEPRPDYAVVTGDIANFGAAAEYERFVSLMDALQLPYFVIAGNHDDRDRLREVLPLRAFGAASGPRLRYAIEDFPIRLVVLDANAPRPWPGAYTDRAATEWLERTLAARRDVPTIVAVHQPPFRTGLHYLDVGGFVGQRRLRAVVDRHPQVRRVICGHIHCVRSAQWKVALAVSAPSTAPQKIPLLFMDRRIVGLRDESPGFSVHALSADGIMNTTVYRRDPAGRYLPT